MPVSSNNTDNSTAQVNSAPCAPANNVALSNDNNNGINGNGATSNDATTSVNSGRQTQALGPFVDVADRFTRLIMPMD
jgi:hypothetical protein